DGSISPLNHFLGLAPKFLLGLALAINPLGILIGSAMLGPMSDRYGRRLLLLATILFSALGHLAVVAALFKENYPLFVVARFVTGLAEGNTSLVGAMLADQLEGELRTRGFALLNGANYAGWLVGPFIAGATVQFGIVVPFELAAFTLLVTFFLGWRAFPKGRTRTTAASSGELHIFALLAHRPIRQLFAIHLARTVGVTAFYEFFPLLLVEYAGFAAGGISIVSGILCAVMTGTSALIGHGYMKTGGPRSLRNYNIATAVCIALACCTNPVIAIGAMIVFGIPNALYNAVLPAYCSERFASHGQGSVMSLLTTIFCISNVIVALVGAGITQIDSRLILLLGVATAAWAGWRIAPWIDAASKQKHALIEEAIL
ncbi:MAG TPA: MFS transporter, partial [Burkholderiaceae bacterium]